ncbi:MAG TPA: PAS domain-containing protein, partial [Caldimonas sp.]
LPAPVALLDEPGVIVSVNAAWKRFEVANGLCGPDFGIGQDYPRLCDSIGGEDAEGARRAARGLRSVLSGAQAEFALEYACHSPIEPRWFRMTVTALLGGATVGAVVTHVDIGERKRAGLEREREHRLLRTLIDALPDVVYTKDSGGRFVVSNRAALALFGFDREQDLAGKTAFDVLAAEVAECVHADDLRVLGGQSVLDREECSTDRTGVSQWHLTIKVPLRDGVGLVTGLVGISRNITERRRAQQESRELVERLGLTLESLSDGFCTLDRDWRFTYVNRRAERMLRRPRIKLLGRLVWECLPGLAGTAFVAALRQAMEQNSVVQLVEHFAPLDRWFEVRIHPSRHGLAVYLRDVSKQRKVATQLETERSRLVAAQAVAKIGSWATELGTGVFEWSDETHRIFGTDPRLFQPTREGFRDLIHPDDRGAVLDAIARSFEQRTTQVIEHRLLLPGGVAKIVEERWQVFRDEQGKPVRALGTCQDITERKRAEQELRASQALLGMVGRLGRIGAWAWDLARDAVTWSDEVCAIHEVAPGTSLDLKQALAFYPPEWADTIGRACRACAVQGTPFDLELEILTARGRRVWVRAIGEAIRDDLGATQRIQGAFQDLSERKRAERETRRLAARLTNTLESITDGFYTVDRSWRLTYVNGEAERMLGRRRDEVIGCVLWEVFPRLLGTEFEHSYRRAMAENRALTLEAYHAPWDAWIRMNCYPSEEGLAVYFRNTSVERASRQRLELLEASVSQLNDIVVITEAAPLGEPGPRILFVNDAFVRTTGHAREDVLGKSPRLLQGPRTDRAELDRIRAALARFEPVHAELVNYTEGGDPYWIEIDIMPVGVEGAGYSHFVAVERDITERKRDQDALRELNAELEDRVRTRTAELNLARDEAEQANRAKSSFLATMSHEIRTPMNGVIGMIDVLHQTSLKGYQVEMIDLIRDSAFSLLEIVEDILDFSKIEAGKMTLEAEPMRLEESVEKVCAMLDHMAVKQDVQMTLFVDPAIPRTLSGDETRVRQVLVNLTGNAIKFSSGRDHPGQVSVRAVLVERQAQTVTIELSVADNGIGMDAATLARLFTPFSQADVSTTRRFGGTGLGLAISDMLVRLMGGTISVRSALGQGSTFTVRLRFAAVEGADADADDDMGTAAAGLRCHIVGGELPLAEDLGSYLTHAGATVESSPNLAAAAAAGPAPGLCLWLILPDEPVAALAELRAMAPGTHGAETRFIVLERGRRRRPRVEAVDLVRIDVDVLFHRTLFKTLALASGRLTEEASNEERDPVSGAAPPEARTKGRLILVAEDNETNRQVILRQLQLVGFAADVVVNGREALASWRSGDYALLLTDLHMPEMDGYELAAAIRAEEREGHRTPIIAVTANALRDEELRCRAAGMDAYLTKPVRLPQLQAAVEAWLGPAAQTRGHEGGAAAQIQAADLNV